MPLSTMYVAALSAAELQNGLLVATPTKSFHLFAATTHDRDEWVRQLSKYTLATPRTRILPPFSSL